jgi:hypothetical protein
MMGRYDKAIADYGMTLNLPKLAAKGCWRIAESYSLEQKSDSAMVWLKKSATSGFKDFEVWKRDKTLSRLWDTKEFRAIAGH